MRTVTRRERRQRLNQPRGAVQPKAKKADGIQHPQMCGASTGTINVYQEGKLTEASMVDGTFIQIAPVALPIAQGTVITALYALDSLGNV